MQTRLVKWGNSHGIRLSKAVLEEAHLKDGDPVTVAVQGGTILIAPARPAYSLRKLLAGIKPGNLHGETDTGPSVGREGW